MSKNIDITSRRLFEFFQVELRNEEKMRREGDDPPAATLFSATDSALQAPSDVLLAWFDLEDMDEQDAWEILMREFLGLSWLICQHGPYTKLADFGFIE